MNDFLARVTEGMRAARFGPGSGLSESEPTITPEMTLRAAGISTKRQAKYQRRMSTLLGKGDA